MSTIKHVAIQMDPIESIKIATDSSFRLALEAQERGYQLYHYHPRDLVFYNGSVTAFARPLNVRDVAGDYYTLGEARSLDLSTMDVVLMRQDPPFDMAYITATHILEHIHPTTLVVNDPFHVRNAPEKLLVTHFADFMPPTMIANRREDLEAFRKEHGDIIIKPLYGHGGAGVFHLRENDENFTALLETFTQLYREPIIAQRFLPEISKGDKRIILVEGKPVGALNRIPAKGNVRSNMAVGGTAVHTQLSKRDQEICEAIGPELRNRGLVFVGIDVIGDYITEINVTSPTGIRVIERLDGVNIAALIWDAIEARRASM